MDVHCSEGTVIMTFRVWKMKITDDHHRARALM